MKAVLPGLAANGTFMIIGAVPSLEVPSFQLLSSRQSVKGWYSGTSIDSQDTLSFSVLTGVRSMNEIFPIEQVKQGYERMLVARRDFVSSLRPGTNNSFFRSCTRRRYDMRVEL